MRYARTDWRFRQSGHDAAGGLDRRQEGERVARDLVRQRPRYGDAVGTQGA